MPSHRTAGVSVVAVVAFFVAVAGLGAQEAGPLGFAADRAATLESLEDRIRGMPSADSMLVWHRAMTAEPHHAATEANVRTAEYLAERLRGFGFDEVRMNRYEVLLPRPTEREVVLVAPERYELKLEEPPLEPDPDTRKEGVLPPFNAFSADGDVEAEVVYVNYGIPDDYEVLDSLGISVEGKIVLARYGRSWRGIKPKVAAEHGAVACILYSDPSDDGYVRGDVMPEGVWRPEHGVQRGSTMDMPTYPGDPQTPGRASKPGVERDPLEEVPTLQEIPVLPISYGDALPILRSLDGPVAPEGWRGGLPVTYHVGPGASVVRMRLRHDWSIRPIVNVIGVLEGSEEPEKVVMAGGHRDAWTFGGRDPISGAVSLLESARALAALAREGHRPKRSIAIGSWDAEEYGLIGSTEYGEEFADELRENMVVYLNRESYTAGSFGASGVHSLQPFINQVTRLVEMPGGGRTVHEAWAADAGEDGTVAWNGREDVRIGALGSGSDYTVFLDHLAVPAVNLGFGSGNGIYHSRYDTHWFFTEYGDPGFEYGTRQAELVAYFLLRLADADVLPYDYAAAAETVEGYLDELDGELESRGMTGAVELGPVRAAARSLEAAGRTLNAERDRLLALGSATLADHDDALERLNRALMAAERGFAASEGLPGPALVQAPALRPGLLHRLRGEDAARRPGGDREGRRRRGPGHGRRPGRRPGAGPDRGGPGGGGRRRDQVGDGGRRPGVSGS